MKRKYLFPVMPLKNSMSGGQEAVKLAKYYSDNGADGILIFDLSERDEEHEAHILLLKEICRAAEIPVYAGGHIRRTEDVKKILYAGCQKAILNFGRESNVEIAKEVSERFGKEKIAFSLSDPSQFVPGLEEWGSLLFWSGSDSQCPYRGELPVVSISPAATDDAVIDVLSYKWVTGISAAYFSTEVSDFMSLKERASERGLRMNTLESRLSWGELKPGRDGLLPVVVQDYKTLEVLMVAYMNEEAYQMTIQTGKMTYFSRSRNELWVKGDTSGHYQYVKSLMADCDMDTILAKVSQVGNACHTGSYSCFFNEIVKREYEETNPLKVFESVMGVIKDRKVHPKEGSYTNYLFDKGIDKILKKLGEEATEIVIASKNPNPNEIKYEIADFLYHMMVLMAEKGVSWEEIVEELAKR